MGATRATGPPQLARSLLSALSGAGVVGAGCGPENGDGGQLLVVREGGRVYEDAGLWRLMADDPLPSRRQRFAAGCQASLNNKSDVSLNASVVVSTNRRLLRAAELVDTGRADAVLASTVESLWLSGEVPLAELDVSTVRSLTDADDAVIEDYLERVAAPPPARYARSMMAVAYSSSTAEQIVTVVPVIVEDGSYRSASPDSTAILYVPATDETWELKVPDTVCRDLVGDGLDVVDDAPFSPPFDE